jgi:hypothetical protein
LALRSRSAWPESLNRIESQPCLQKINAPLAVWNSHQREAAAMRSGKGDSSLADGEVDAPIVLTDEILPGLLVAGRSTRIKGNIGESPIGKLTLDGYEVRRVPMP